MHFVDKVKKTKQDVFLQNDIWPQKLINNALFMVHLTFYK